MSCQSGPIVRSKLVLQTGGRLVRLLRSAHPSRAASQRHFTALACRQCGQGLRGSKQAQSIPLLGDRRPSRWGCKLSTSCQATATSPHAAVVEKAEAKVSKQQGQLVPLPTTDESPELDRIRHSVSNDLIWQLCTAQLMAVYP